MSKDEIEDLLAKVDDDECILVKVLDRDSGESLFHFNEGYYRNLPDYPLELINIFVDYILEKMNLEIFHISGNQIMTYDGLFVVTQKNHLDRKSFKYSNPVK